MRPPPVRSRGSASSPDKFWVPGDFDTMFADEIEKEFYGDK